jgi:hypothetical protein
MLIAWLEKRSLIEIIALIVLAIAALVVSERNKR